MILPRISFEVVSILSLRGCPLARYTGQVSTKVSLKVSSRKSFRHWEIFSGDCGPVELTDWIATWELQNKTILSNLSPLTNKYLRAIRIASISPSNTVLYFLADPGKCRTTLMVKRGSTSSWWSPDYVLVKAKWYTILAVLWNVYPTFYFGG